MLSPRAVACIERLIWILIYGGLFAAVLGIATLRHSAVAGWVLSGFGAVLTATGVVLVWVRSRLPETS
jgi:hypothetical protein